MTDQEMTRMNDYLLEQSLIMHERQEERDYYGNDPYKYKRPDDQFYIPWQSDFRARMYPPFHNHQGSNYHSK